MGIYLDVEEKKDLEQVGPFLKMNKDAIKFREIHPDAYTKKGRLYCKLPKIGNARDFINNLLQKIILQKKKQVV